MARRIFRVLVISGVLTAFTSVTQARQRDEQGAVAQDQKSIVGSWIGGNEAQEIWLTSFTSDGIVLNSLQSEVSTTRPIGVLTPAHGAWAHLRGRQYAITERAVFYDIETGELRALGKLRGVLTLNKAGDVLTGTLTAEGFGADGTLLFTLAHSLRFTRIEVEAVD